jgi:hypothetical protein
MLTNKTHVGARNVGQALQQTLQFDKPVSTGTVISSARRYAATCKKEIKFSKGKPQGDMIFNKHGVHDWVLQQDGHRAHAQPSQHALAAYSKQHKHNRCDCFQHGLFAALPCLQLGTFGLLCKLM